MCGECLEHGGYSMTDRLSFPGRRLSEDTVQEIFMGSCPSGGGHFTPQGAH